MPNEENHSKRQRLTYLGWLLVGAALALEAFTMLGLLGNAPAPAPVRPGTVSIDSAVP
ncbi:MAG: hypothetical protein JSR82_09730 [Verrucomicrobia bacterium]|nr:hypothetical protein [Verrucomicrobiota bacterium]